MATSDPSNPVRDETSIQATVPLVTREILESYLSCKYKGYLKLSRRTGTPSDYELLMKDIQSELTKQAETKLAARYGSSEPPTGVRIDFACLKRGIPLIFDGLIMHDGLSIQVDGLIRIDEPSRLGDFQCVPVLIHEREKIEPEQRQLLALL
jgi:hypothetical protein